jgi:hypothetical protein
MGTGLRNGRRRTVCARCRDLAYALNRMERLADAEPEMSRAGLRAVANRLGIVVAQLHAQANRAT